LAVVGLVSQVREKKKKEIKHEPVDWVQIPNDVNVPVYCC